MDILGRDVRVDVLIAGAGNVGGMLACALAQGGMTVGLLDHRPQETLEGRQDLRVYAIAQGAVPFLSKIGLWQALSPSASPIGTIRTTLQGGSGVIVYRAQDVGGQALGHMVPSGLVAQELHRLCEATPGITCWRPCKIVGRKTLASCVEITLEGGSVVQAKVLVGADGRNSALRDEIGGVVFKKSYDHLALVATVAHTAPHHHTAFEHFTPDGPLAFLPCMGTPSAVHQSALVWSLKAARAEALLAEPKIFLNALIHHFGWGLGDLRLLTGLQGYQTSLLIPQRIVGPRSVLVGDAAHVIHPLAGQGLNLGLRDADTLSDALLAAYRLGLDWGAESVLTAWARPRRLDHGALAGLTHGLVTLFDQNNPFLNRLASLGFRGVNACLPLKKRLIRHAMGGEG